MLQKSPTMNRLNAFTPKHTHTSWKVQSTAIAVTLDTSVAYFYRAMLCIHGTSHGPVSVRLSVCLSVTRRSCTKTAKRRICFLKPKISAKFDQGHPLRGRQMQVGWVKIGDFRQITGYISKTVQDRCMVSIKVE